MVISISGRALLCTTLKHLLAQLTRVMRLTALLPFIVSIHVGATTYSQTVSFSDKNVPPQIVFVSFEKQAGLSFFFNYALIKDIKPVTVDMREMSLDEVLVEVSVEVRNGKKSALTDAKGVFELKNVPIGTVLAKANNQLDQVQVIAYGATTERLSTGNVTTVNTVRIQAQNSFGEGNDPFYVIDGVPYSSKALHDPISSVADQAVPLQTFE